MHLRDSNVFSNVTDSDMDPGEAINKTGDCGGTTRFDVSSFTPDISTSDISLIGSDALLSITEINIAIHNCCDTIVDRFCLLLKVCWFLVGMQASGLENSFLSDLLSQKYFAHKQFQKNLNNQYK